MVRAPRPRRFHSRLLALPAMRKHFNSPDAAYKRVKAHHFPRLHEKLKGKLRHNFDTARDLVETLADGRFALLKNADVVADNSIRSMYDFLVLQDHGDKQTGNRRVYNFLEKLMSSPDKALQAALEVTVGTDTRKPFILTGRKNKEGKQFRTLVTFADIPFEGGAVRPQIDFDYDMLEHFQSDVCKLFHKGSNLLILGYFRLQQVRGRKNPVFFLRADIGNIDLAVPFDYEAVVAAGRAADERRQTRPWLKPYQFGR